MPGRATNEPTNYIALGKQTALGSEASTFTFFRHLDGSGLEFTEDVESVREGGDGQEVGLRYKTALSADGALVANARPEMAARLLAWTLGVDAPTAPLGLATVASGITNDHWLTPAATLPYLTADQFWADQVERAVDAKITSLDIEFEQGRPLKMTANMIGGGTAYFPASPQSPTRETSQPFYFPGASVTIEGAGNALVTKGSIKIDRGMDTDIRTTGLNRQDVIETSLDISGAFTLKYENATLYDKVHAGGAGGSQVPVELATGAMSLWQSFGAGTQFRHLGLFAPGFHYTQARVNKLDPDGKTMYLDVAWESYKAATHAAYARVLCASIAALV